MSKEAIVETKDLTRVYKVGEAEIVAVDNVSLEVRKGEFLSIMGPSGSGKSTLLNLIGCVDRPTRGTVLIEGRDVNQLSEKELDKLRLEKIGFVFQTFNLIPTLTTLENVELPMVLAGRSKEERMTQAEELLKLVGLSHRLRHRPHQLSVGEMQRVGIARALANDPVIILADEPTGNVDSESAEQVVGLFKQLNTDYSATILIVTHNPDVAKEAGKVLRLKDGRIVG